MTVIDPFTVKFELKTTDAAFLNYLATNPDGAIVPKGVENLNTQPVGTGPFIFEAYQPNQQFSLTANPNYYEKGLPYLSKVVFKFYKDQATLSSALRSKAIDMTWLKDPKVAALLAQDVAGSCLGARPDFADLPGLAEHEGKAARRRQGAAGAQPRDRPQGLPRHRSGRFGQGRRDDPGKPGRRL